MDAKRGPKSLILGRGPGGLCVPGLLGTDAEPHRRHHGVEYFRPCLRLRLDNRLGLLMVVQAGRVLKLMQEYAQCVFASINHDGVGLTGHTVPTINVLAKNGLTACRK